MGREGAVLPLGRACLEPSRVCRASRLIPSALPLLASQCALLDCSCLLFVAACFGDYITKLSSILLWMDIPIAFSLVLW